MKRETIDYYLDHMYFYISGYNSKLRTVYAVDNRLTDDKKHKSKFKTILHAQEWIRKYHVKNPRYKGLPFKIMRYQKFISIVISEVN